MDLIGGMTSTFSLPPALTDKVRDNPRGPVVLRGLYFGLVTALLMEGAERATSDAVTWMRSISDDDLRRGSEAAALRVSDSVAESALYPPTTAWGVAADDGRALAAAIQDVTRAVRLMAVRAREFAAAAREEADATVREGQDVREEAVAAGWSGEEYVDAVAAGWSDAEYAEAVAAGWSAEEYAEAMAAGWSAEEYAEEVVARADQAGREEADLEAGQAAYEARVAAVRAEARGSFPASSSSSFLSCLWRSSRNPKRRRDTFWFACPLPCFCAHASLPGAPSGGEGDKPSRLSL